MPNEKQTGPGRLRSRRRKPSQRPQKQLGTTIGERVGYTPKAAESTPEKPRKRGRDRQRSNGRRRGLPRLAAEFAFVTAQRDVRAELLPGTPPTILLRRGRHVVAMLTVGSEEQARKLLGLPGRRSDSKAIDLLWEVDRREPSLMDVSHAN